MAGNKIKLYSYIEYDSIPLGVEWVDLNHLVPYEKCLNNRMLAGNTQIGESYSTMGDIVRFKIMQETDDIWMDSDVFVLKNINDFKKEVIISGEMNGWYDKQTPCFGALGISTHPDMVEDLYALAEEYLVKGIKPEKHDRYIRYLQNEFTYKYYDVIKENYMSHLFACPISVKNRGLLSTDFKIPIVLKDYIFGIHLWNTGFAAKAFGTVYDNKHTLLGALYSLSNSDKKEYGVNSLTIFDINNKNINKFYLDRLELPPKGE